MMIEARWHGALIARSEDTVVVEGNHYFPADTVDAVAVDEVAFEREEVVDVGVGGSELSQRLYLPEPEHSRIARSRRRNGRWFPAR